MKPTFRVFLVLLMALAPGWSLAHDPGTTEAPDDHAAAEPGGVIHVPAGHGRQVWVVGDTYTFKATGEDTGGRLFAFEALVPPAAGPPPHVHLEQDEAYYLLEGELEVISGSRTLTAAAGSFVFVPKGTEHAFRNTTEKPARMLIWVNPAGLEEFFLAVGQDARPGENAPPLGPEEMARTVELAPRYGLELKLPLPDGEEPAAAGPPID